MGEPLHHIDRLFKKAVEQHIELPSSKVWEHLEKNLHKRKLTCINKKYKKWKWVAAALFIFSVGLGMYTVNLKLKYKKGIEKRQGKDNIDNSKNSPYSTHLPAGNSKNKIGVDSLGEKETKPKTAVNNVIGAPSSGDEKSKSKSRIAQSGKSANEVPGSLNKNEIRKTRSSEINVSASTNKKVATNKYNRSINSQVNNKNTRFSTRREIAVANLNTPANNLGTHDSQKTPVGDPALSTGKNEVLNTGRSVISYSTEGKTIDQSPGTANIPERLLKDQPAVSTFLLHNSDAADNSKTNNKINPGSMSFAVNHGKYKFSVYYSQNFVSPDIKPNHTEFKEDNYLQIKSHEKNRVATVFGLSMVRNLGRKIGIETGVSLHTFITDIGAKSMVARRDNNGKVNYRLSTSSGFAYYSIKNRPNPVSADTLKTISSTSKVKYISVPLGLQYHIYIGRRLTVNPAAGLAANFASGANITTIQSLERTYTSELEGLKSRYFDGVLSLDISYFINRKIGISVRPSSNFALSDATETKPVITRRNAFGVAAGLHFSF